MTATIAFVKPIGEIKLSPGSTVTIPHVSWQEFEFILQDLGEHRSSRVVYSKGTLEVMVPLPEQETAKEFISDIVKTLLKKTGKRYEPFGSTTFKLEGTAGVEPDACFYIQNYQRMIGCRRLQADDPPPDLAIEIDVTSRTPLEAYQAIGVPELWVYGDRQLTIYLLEKDRYIQSEISPNFPNIALIQMIPAAIARSWQVGSVQALEELAATIQQ